MPFSPGFPSIGMATERPAHYLSCFIPPPDPARDLYSG
jgi:hypothetical protein